MGKGTMQVFVTTIKGFRTTEECDAAIEALYEHKKHVANIGNLGSSNVKKLIETEFREWRAIAGIQGEGNGFKCRYCNRKLLLKRFTKFYFADLNARALHNGQEIVVRACCLPCQTELEQRYEKECLCLQQQREELVQLKKVAKAMSRGVSDLLKKESRRAKSSPAS